MPEHQKSFVVQFKRRRVKIWVHATFAYLCNQSAQLLIATEHRKQPGESSAKNVYGTP
jgi:uncharacterized membrane protein YhhN